VRKGVNRQREEKLRQKGVCIRTSNNVILFISDVQSTLNGVIRTHARGEDGERQKTQTWVSSSTIPLSSSASATKSWGEPRPSLSGLHAKSWKREKRPVSSTITRGEGRNANRAIISTESRRHVVSQILTIFEICEHHTNVS
jgi:hypothetical protein